MNQNYVKPVIIKRNSMELKDYWNSLKHQLIILTGKRRSRKGNPVA
jgi:hypothetical protein